MSRKKILQRPRRRPTTGDLRHRITIQNRSITPPDLNEYDLDHDFETHREVWASVETISGETIFDGVQGDDVVSHQITFRWLEGVTAESWILLNDGTRIDILADENIEERGQFIVVKGKRTGLATNSASQG